MYDLTLGRWREKLSLIELLFFTLIVMFTQSKPLISYVMQSNHLPLLSEPEALHDIHLAIRLPPSPLL